MEWIETTANTVEEARELALDQLGVDESEAEFEVLEEPKTSLFGRTKGVARVRVRIIPKAPRPKTDRKRHNKKRSDDADSREASRSSKGSSKSGGSESDKGYRKSTDSNKGEGSAKSQSDGADSPSGEPNRSSGRNRSNERKKEPMDQAEQIATVEGFLVDLAKAFGLTASVESSFEDGDLSANIKGEGLGYLVGPRLATLDSIQEIARTTLQRQAAGREYARVTVDVEGIRQRRSEALSEFVQKAADQVRDEHVTVVFEVMSSADRKRVHDTASGLEGIRSGSEGEDPRRRVALSPATE